MTRPIKLSIVIRCRNEAQSLAKVFEALKFQKCNFAWEVVVVDNESTDDTREVCETISARVVSISSSHFTYGRALNLGIEQAQGELILLLSSHSLPIGSSFLQNAIAHFEDPRIAAARCLMIGNPDQIAAWSRPRIINYESSEDQRRIESGTSWLGDYPTAGCCVIRRSVWSQVAFDETLEANEDKLWASKVLSLGYSTLCCSEAVWLYTRKRSKAAERNRRMREHLSLYRISGRPPLKLSEFFSRCALAFLVAPWIALKHFKDSIVWNFILVTIPIRARWSARAGSFAEFSEKQ